MESENTNKAGAQANKNGAQKQPGLDLSGLDLSGVLPPGAWEAIKPLLVSGASAAAIYYLFIKPLKEKVEAQAKIIEEIQERLDIHREHILKLEQRLDEMQKNAENRHDQKTDDRFDEKHRSTFANSNLSGNYRRRNFNL